MAVQAKTIRTPDRNSGRAGTPNREVHYIKILKGNRKGAAAAIGGALHDHYDNNFHIILCTKVNGKEQTLSLTAGDVVFRTGESNRWQVLTRKGFNKRFPLAKI